MTVNELIEQFSPCEEGEKFLREQGTLEAAWDACVQADWMLWLDSRLDLLTPRQRVEFACRCVRETPAREGTVWDLLTDDRSRRAVETAETFLRGEATEEELKIAAREARKAREAAAARATWEVAAARATWEVALAAREAATEAQAAAEAWAAAWAAAEASRTAEEAERAAAQAFQCRLLREMVPNPFRNCDTVANP
jgi:hypothetical protein